MSHLVPFALPARLEALREQGTQNLVADPDHDVNQQEQDKPEHRYEKRSGKKLNHT